MLMIMKIPADCPSQKYSWDRIVAFKEHLKICQRKRKQQNKYKKATSGINNKKNDSNKNNKLLNTLKQGAHIF